MMDLLYLTGPFRECQYQTGNAHAKEPKEFQGAALYLQKIKKTDRDPVLTTLRPVHDKKSTNAVEGFHRQVRKVTKTKGAFTSDMALLKLVYLATKNIEKKWTSPLHNWSLTVQQLYIKFGERIPLVLNTDSSGASPGGIGTTDRV